MCEFIVVDLLVIDCKFELISVPLLGVGAKYKQMKTLSLKIDDCIFEETERILSKSKKPRNRYINEALDYYNKFQKRNYLEYKLKNESLVVAEDSMLMLSDFESLDYIDESNEDKSCDK